MSDEPLRAKVATYGGGQTVQHWTLYVGREGIADTSVPETAALYEAIAHRLNDVQSQNQALQESLRAIRDATGDYPNDRVAVLRQRLYEIERLARNALSPTQETE